MTQKHLSFRSQGAEVIEGGVRYRTWAPGKTKVDVVVYQREGVVARELALTKESDGYFSASDERGSAGDFYKYRIDGEEFPDPASRFNPAGVHGFAQVIDPRSFVWRDKDWICPPLAEVIIYELHIGTFTEEGTFLAAIEKLDHLVELGVTAIEIMPVADFPGDRSWGYDGVLLYAPSRAYGQPNDLRTLVAAAHARRLAVILDVVYNHLGPDGNYLGCYSRDYFNPSHKTPWGDGLNFELQPVRDFFAENAEYWRREFHVDGFRFDATHAIVDTSKQHFLAEVAERIHSLGGFVTVEDERNEAQLLRPAARGGLGLDSRWADDFHHVVRVMLTGMRESYYRSYEGTADELTETLRDGWLLHGEERQRKDEAGSAELAKLAPEQFIFCISNHDQIGNQAFGQRLTEFTSLAGYRAASALLCLVPYTPLLFMGQEWAATTPFQFFTNHEPDLGRRVTEGRREEFKGFALFRDPAMREKIPDPQAKETFLRSKLRWEERTKDEHGGILRLYTEVLRLRRSLPAIRERTRGRWQVLEPGDGIVRLIYGRAGTEQLLIDLRLTSGAGIPARMEEGWELLLSTNEARFGGEEAEPFTQPELRLLRKEDAALTARRRQRK